MPTLLLVLLIPYTAFHAFACAHVADTKGYSWGGWFILGALFGVFALLAVGLCETAELHNERQEKKRAALAAARAEREAKKAQKADSLRPPKSD